MKNGLKQGTNFMVGMIKNDLLDIFMKFVNFLDSYLSYLSKI